MRTRPSLRSSQRALGRWLLLLPYLIANCQTQSYVKVVRDKMLRIQLQEREKSFTTQLRTSARVVPVRGRTIVMQKVEESKVGEETSTVLVKNDGEPGASSSLLPRSPRIGTVTARSAGHNASAQLSPDIFTGSPLEARRVVERRGESGAKRKRRGSGRARPNTFRWSWGRPSTSLSPG